MNVAPTASPNSSRYLRPGRLFPVLMALVVILSGCTIGGGDDAEPTATAPTGSGPGAGTVAPRLVGELADQIATAWLSVGSYRATTTQGSGDLSTIPAPAPPVSAAQAVDPNATWQSVVDEIVLPDQRHYLESSGGSISEFTAVDGRVYARGRFTQIAIRPDIDATTWVNLDPAFISADSNIGVFLTAFNGGDAAAFRPPLSDLQADTRQRELTAVGTIDVGGRACAAYRWVDTGDTGGAMTRVVSIDAAGLPCSLEFIAGDYTSRVVWDAYNLLPPVVAPAESVTVGETMDMGATGATPAPGVGAPAATPGAGPDVPATPVHAGTPAPAATPLAG